MSLWQRIRDFFVGPPRPRHDEPEGEEWAKLDWPDQPDVEERNDPVRGAAPAWGADEEPTQEPFDRVLADHDEREIGQPVLDDDGEPVIVLGLFGGAVRQGPLVVRRTSGKNAVSQFLVYDMESGAHWPVTPEELDSETTHRVGG